MSPLPGGVMSQREKPPCHRGHPYAEKGWGGRLADSQL